MAKSCSFALLYSNADASTLFFLQGKGKKQHMSNSRTKKDRRTSINVNSDILTSQDGQQIFQWKEPNSPAQLKREKKIK